MGNGCQGRQEVGGVRARVRAVIGEGLRDAGLQVTEVDEDRWLTVLAGEHKRTIPVELEVGDRTLRVTSLFAGAPDESHQAVFRMLLQRNRRPGPVHFALDEAGDIILTGALPLTGVDAQTFDELLGAVLTLADSTYDRVLQTGFATYLAAEQRWRAQRGLPPNPVGEPTPPQ